MMNPNPVLRKLGLRDDDRVVIIHTDDIGMCQASVAAFADLNEVGIISSGAVMVPCPWFPAAAAFHRDHPNADLGVHLTLTSEWLNYRWGPVSTRVRESGLMDAEGFFFRASKPAQDSADASAAAIELESQIERALAFGMKPTHIDTHMGTVAHPKFMGAYIQLAMKYCLPPMMFRTDEAGWLATGMDAETAAMAARIVRQVEANGLPLLDGMSGMPLDKPDDRFERTTQMLAALPVGITHFIIHPSKDTPELRAITPDWACRVADYETFMRAELRQFIQDNGLHVIGYRALQELMN